MIERGESSERLYQSDLERRLGFATQYLRDAAEIVAREIDDNKFVRELLPPPPSMGEHVRMNALARIELNQKEPGIVDGLFTAIKDFDVADEPTRHLPENKIRKIFGFTQYAQNISPTEQNTKQS